MRVNRAELIDHKGISPTLIHLTCLLVTLSFGYTYGEGNHAVQLLDGMAAYQPDFLAHDWFVRETEQYHKPFSLLVAWGLALGSLPWFLAAANFFTIYFTLWGFYRIAGHLTENHRQKSALIFLGVLIFILHDGTLSIKATALHANLFQPSSFSVLFMTMAMERFLVGRWFHSGIALGLCGLFHLNFLILGIGVFGLAHLQLAWTMYREKQWHFGELMRRCFSQFLPALGVLLWILPMVLSMQSAEHAERAAEILFTIRAPHHYSMVAPLHTYVEFFGYFTTSLGSLILLRQSDLKIHQTMHSLVMALFIPVIAAIVLPNILGWDLLTRYFMPRIASFAEIIAVVLFLRLVFSDHHRNPPSLKDHPWGILLLVAGVLLTGWQRPYPYFTVLTLLLLLAFLWMVRHRLLPGRLLNISGRWGLAVMLVVMASVAWLERGRIQANFADVARMDINYAEEPLYAWSRTTDPASQFMIPPDLAAFRLQGQRAVLVDWKCDPSGDRELLQWYQRLGDISGRADFKQRSELLEGYATMDAQRLDRLQKRYHIDYVVLRAGMPAAALLAEEGLPTAYRDARFVVFQLSGG